MKRVSESAGCMLKTKMRKVWEEHIFWTRNVIFCVVDGLPGEEQVVNRLLSNQDEIGNLFANYYGAENGNLLSELLKLHIKIGYEVMTDAKNSNLVKFRASNAVWIQNAHKISIFLNKINPKLDLDTMKDMMNNHLRLTTNEVTQRINKNYDFDIEAYDEVHSEILKMSDILTIGIITQFPRQFHNVQVAVPIG
jgi:hypothetical protein